MTSPVAGFSTAMLGAALLLDGRHRFGFPS